MINYKEKMKSEIQARLNSQSWNFAIAHDVLQKIELKKERRIFAGYVASLVAASAFIILFVFNVYFYFNIMKESNYNLYSSYSNVSSLSEIDDVDLIINEAFPMR